MIFLAGLSMQGWNVITREFKSPAALTNNIMAAEYGHTVKFAMELLSVLAYTLSITLTCLDISGIT